MKIQRIWSGGGTTSINFSNAIGDLLIMFAFRDGSTTNPTVPADWTTITNTYDGTSCSISMAYRIATTADIASGTWTNANVVVGVVYRAVVSSGVPVGTVANNAGTNNTINYPARALAVSNIIGSSWFVAFAGHRSADTTLEIPPANMGLVLSYPVASAEGCIFDTNGYAPANWPSTNVTITGTASGWITAVIEIKAEGEKLNNFNFPTSVSAGVISITEKLK
jgi:hypothetical protein